ncbi:hypothetical protein [Breoghania sp. JC706]|uniref:hypothetical protein n=1 Tax=Breoghania sp. JC706 TaxID=3117732 RepID=UPI00300A3CC9
MASAAERSFLDRPAARLLALIVAALAATALAWINRDAFVSAPVGTTATAGNPDLAACLAERGGAVDRMKQDGVIDARQYNQFRARAEAFCAAQYPAQ